MAAVEVIVEKLKDGNTDNPRFKEELEATKSLVSDPEVQSLIEGAVSAVEKIPVYLETNLYRLQKLFWLLNNELQRYIDEVVEQEKLLDATWEENRRPLDEKREGLEKQVTAASEDLVDGKKVIEQANEQIQKAQAVLDGVTPKKLEATNAEVGSSFFLFLAFFLYFPLVYLSFPPLLSCFLSYLFFPFLTFFSHSHLFTLCSHN